MQNPKTQQSTPIMEMEVVEEAAPVEVVEEKPDDYVGPEFELPAGYIPPDDAQDGEDISVLAKIRMKPDGKACLVSLDGAEFGKKIEPADKPEEVVEGSQSTEDDSPLSERMANIRRGMAKY